MKKLSLILLVSFVFDSSSALAQDLKNPALNNCVNALPFAPSTTNPTRPSHEYDCVPTPVDGSGKLTNAADRDYTQWNDTLLTGADKKQVNGFYTKKGARCATATQATTDCPIAVKAKFVFACGDITNTANYNNGKCAQAKSIKVYHATYQAVAIPGEAPIRPTIVGDGSIDARAFDATPIATATISTSNGKGSYKCADLQVQGGPPLFQKGEDEYGNPICLQDTTVEKMREQICELQMKNLWTQSGGGSSQDPCDGITVSKVFKLSNPGKTDKTINDCKDAGGIVFDKTGATRINDFSSYPGGTLSGLITSESAFMTKYKISSGLVSPTFLCKMSKPVDKVKESTSNDTLYLDADFVPGSIVVDYLLGGGGGGGSSGMSSGGFGGSASTNASGSLAGVKKTGQTCSITIGAGGAGADAGADSCGKGKAGNSSSIVCEGGSLTASGGSGSGSCDGGCSGSGGGGSILAGGGSGSGGCAMGGNGSYGSGGGGGATCDSGWLNQDICGVRSGGSGGGGYAKIKYQVYEYTPW